MNNAPVSQTVLDAAIAWRLQLDAGAATGAFEEWLHAHPDHARVWQQFQVLDRRLAEVGRAGGAALNPHWRFRRLRDERSV